MSNDIRVASFVRSQVPHLELYKQQGLAHLSHWLEAHPIESAPDTTFPYRNPSKTTNAVIDKHEGVRAVNVLAEHVVTQARPNPIKVPTVKLLSRERTRMVDRMKSKDGLERSSSGVGSSKTIPRSIEPTSGSRVDRIGQEEVLLTRKELKGKVDKERVFQNPNAEHRTPKTDQLPTASPSSRPALAAQVPSAVSSLSSKRHRESASFDFEEPMEELLIMSPTRKGAEHDSLSPTIDRPSASHRSKPQSQQQPKLRLKHKSATKKKIESQAKARAVKSRRTPDTAQSDDEDVVVRLNHRREKRRAKAEIIRPRAQGPSASTSSSRALKDHRRKDPPVEKKLPGRVTENKTKAADLGKAAGLSLGLMDHFKAGNLGKKIGGRLTLTRSGPTVGVFNKGMSSAQVSAKGSSKIVGIPDLVFSESRFFAKHQPPASSVSSTTSNSQSSSSAPPEKRSAPLLSPSQIKKHRNKETWLVRKLSMSPVAVGSNELSDSVKKRKVVYSPSWPSGSEKSADHEEGAKVERDKEVRVEKAVVTAQTLNGVDTNPWDLVVPPRSATVPPILPNLPSSDEKAGSLLRSSSQPCPLTKCPSPGGSLIRSHQRVTPHLNELPSDSTDSMRLLLRAFDRANPARRLTERTTSQMSLHSGPSVDRVYPRSRSIMRRSSRASASNRSSASCVRFLSDASQLNRRYVAGRSPNLAISSAGSDQSYVYSQPVHLDRQIDDSERDRFGWDSTALSLVANDCHNGENEDEDLGPSRSDETRIYTLDEDLAFWGDDDDVDERGLDNSYNNPVHFDPASAYNSRSFHPSRLYREGGPSSSRPLGELPPKTTLFTHTPVSSFYPHFPVAESTRFTPGGYQETAFLGESIDRESVPQQDYGLSVDDDLDRVLATHWKPHRT